MTYAGTAYASAPYAGPAQFEPAAPADPTAVLAGTAPDVSGDFVGSHVGPPITGALTGVAAGVSGSFAAAASVAPIDASFAGTAPVATGSFSGGSPDAITATLASVAPAFFGDFAASYAAPVVIIGTDTTYANDGYNYDSIADVVDEPPVAATPAHLPREKVKRVHQSMPAPTLVNGRPT